MARLQRDEKLMQRIREEKQLNEVSDYLGRVCWDLRSGLNLRKSLCKVPSAHLPDCIPTSPSLHDPFFHSVIEPKLDHFSREILSECYAKSSL